MSNKYKDMLHINTTLNTRTIVPGVAKDTFVHSYMYESVKR